MEQQPNYEITTSGTENELYLAVEMTATKEQAIKYLRELMNRAQS
jgi:hypothetical protein